MALPRHLITFEPTADGIGRGKRFYVFSGYDCNSPRDRGMRLVELAYQADDIASLRAAGYSVVFDIRGTRESLINALLSKHPTPSEDITAGVLWNGHGSADGSLGTGDGSNVRPSDLPPEISANANCKLFVLAACSAGASKDKWRDALGPQAYVFGWDHPVTTATGIEFFSPDQKSLEDLDDLLRDHLGVTNLGGNKIYPETIELLKLEEEHARFYNDNPLALATGALGVGKKVLAQWKSGEYFEATLTDFDGQRYLATWSDGDAPLWVQPYQTRALGSPTTGHVPGTIRVGSHGRGRWRNGQLYSATLVDFDGEKYLAKWHDGDEPMWLHPSEFELEEASATGDPSRWKVGMKVRAQWRDGKFYDATLTEFDGGRFLATWTDGDEPMWVSPGAILPA
ncbi:MAG: hypothetical protein U0165_08930 [Polyangiaceae bacterium]